MSVPEGDLAKKKTEKYDRQLRLWGQEGQQKIESAHICVLNGGPVGSETLKNLVLPGIGEFTIIDGKKVTNRDLGNNFFVELDSIGKSRAEEVTRLLYELNDMVRDKHAVEQDPEVLIDSNPDFVKDYTVIIATELTPAAILKLSAACTKHNKILIVIRANGLIGYIRVQAGEHTIVQSKPSFPPEDLRLNTPFHALAQFAENVNYVTLDDMHFAHIPYPVILLKEVETWKSSHNGALPTADAEKDAFRAQIQHRKRKSDMNENFDEASQKAHFAWLPYKIPDGIVAILNDPKAITTTAESSNFWLLTNAVKQFVENEGNGKLPLMGTIPDMTSDTHSFVQLQYIYREKSLQDAEIVKRHLHTNLLKLGLSTEKISNEEIQNFCKHSLFLQVLRYSTIVDEQNPSKVNVESIGMGLVDWLAGDDSPGEACWYIALRAADKFHATHGRYPGETESYDQDFDSLRKYTDEVLNSFEFATNQVNDAYLKELCRFGNSQIHTIAAILGGISAQEVIKLVSSQWVPLDNTFVFNGINSTSIALKV